MMMKNYSKKSNSRKILGAGGMTMVEVLIAVILVSVVMLAGTAVWIGGHKQFINVVAPYGTAKVQGELDYAMEHMTRNIRTAYEVKGYGTGGQISGSTYLYGRETETSPWFKYEWRGSPNYDIEYTPTVGSSETFPDTDTVRAENLKFEGTKDTTTNKVMVKITITPQVRARTGFWTITPGVGTSVDWVTGSNYDSGVSLAPELNP